MDDSTMGDVEDCSAVERRLQGRATKKIPTRTTNQTLPLLSSAPSCYQAC